MRLFGTILIAFTLVMGNVLFADVFRQSEALPVVSPKSDLLQCCGEGDESGNVYVIGKYTAELWAEDEDPIANFCGSPATLPCEMAAIDKILRIYDLRKKLAPSTIAKAEMN